MSELPLADWRDFYVMIGTAAGAIVGATFVVATLAGDRTRGLEDRLRGFRGFITPSAVHLGVVLVACAVLAMPTLDYLQLAAILGFGGAAGTVYALVVTWRIWHMDIAKLDLSDWSFYVLLPVLSYVGMSAAGYLAWRNEPQSLQWNAVVLLALLIIGMRNAWDMASFMLLRDPGPKS